MDAFLQHVKTPPLLFIFTLHPLVLLVEQMDLLRELMWFCCSFILDSRWDWMATPRQSRSTEAPYTSHVMPCLSQTTSCGLSLISASCCVGPPPFFSASSIFWMVREWSDFCWKLAVRRQVGQELASSLAPELRKVRLRSSMSSLQTWWNDGLLTLVTIPEWCSGEPTRDELAAGSCRAEQLLRSTWVPTSLCWWNLPLMSVMDAESLTVWDLPEWVEEAVSGLRDDFPVPSLRLRISGFLFFSFPGDTCVPLGWRSSSWNKSVSVWTGDSVLASKVRPRLRRPLVARQVFTSSGAAVGASVASGAEPPPIVKPKVVLVLRLEVATRPEPTHSEQTLQSDGFSLLFDVFFFPFNSFEKPNRLGIWLMTKCH